MIISSAENVLLDMGILPRPGPMFHPHPDAELLGQRVFQHLFGHDSRGISSIELKDLIGFSTLVPRQRCSPRCRRSRRRQQIHAILGGSAELPLTSDGVGVTVASLADVVGGEAEGGAQIAQGAGSVAELEASRGQQRLGLDACGVIHSLRYSAPARRADPVDLFLTSRKELVSRYECTCMYVCVRVFLSRGPFPSRVCYLLAFSLCAL